MLAVCVHCVVSRGLRRDKSVYVDTAEATLVSWPECILSLQTRLSYSSIVRTASTDKSNTQAAFIAFQVSHDCYIGTHPKFSSTVATAPVTTSHIFHVLSNLLLNYICKLHPRPSRPLRGFPLQNGSQMGDTSGVPKVIIF